jgi:hypothetical protein
MRILMLVPLCLTFLSAADNRPSFTGTWKMDADRSDFGQVPKPANFVRKIEHEDPKVHVVTTASTPNGDAVVDVRYTTDGKETVNTVRGGEWTSKMVWDGTSLDLNSKRSLNGAEISTRERWTLTNKGKVLTVINTTTTPQTNITFTVVMNKE